MAIEFECECGKKLSVPDEVAGHKAKCPSCGAVLTAPGTPPPAEGEAPPENKVDQVVEGVREDIARSRERAPQLTTFAIALGGWWAAVLLLVLILSLATDYFHIVNWILVWLPQGLVGGAIAYGMIKADPRTPKCLSLAAPLIVGANYVMFWQSALATQYSGIMVLPLLIALVNIGGFAFLYFTFRKPETQALFAEAPGGVVEAEETAGEPPSEPPADAPADAQSF